MGFVAPAAPFISAAVGVAQIRQQGAIGKYNQQVQNRNAKIKEQEAQILDDKLNLELSQFDQQFQRLQGNQTVNTLKSGVIFSGSAQNVALSNLFQAELERDIARYNNEIGKARRFEEANFSRIQGNLARQRARLAQIQTASQVGTSLLTMGKYTPPGD